MRARFGQIVFRRILTLRSSVTEQYGDSVLEGVKEVTSTSCLDTVEAVVVGM